MHITDPCRLARVSGVARSERWIFKKHYFKGYGVGVLKRFVFALHRAWVARFAVQGHVARPRSRYLFRAAPT